MRYMVANRTTAFTDKQQVEMV
uniref:Uncharacterized protein n=1 Tax=Anguilla anguilla TaxID=7936 RepID=A0A0E9U0Q2_ANGAN